MGEYELEIVTSSHNPILSGNKSNSPDGHIGDIERLQQSLAHIIVEVGFPAVKATHDPVFGWMKVNGLDAV